MNKEKINLSIFLSESNISDNFSNLKIDIIESGFNVSKRRYYSEKALKETSDVFKDKKMYFNHDYDKSQQKKLGARDLRDWAGTIKEVSVRSEGQKIITSGKAVIHNSEMKKILKEAKENGVLDQIGVSIDASGIGSIKKIDNIKTTYVESFSDADSVDFVTRPGAGGKTKNFLESEQDMKIEELNLENLKEKNPDFLKGLIESVSETVKTVIDEKFKEVNTDEKEKKENGPQDLKEASEDNSNNKFEEMQKRIIESEAKVDRKELINNILTETSLPKSSKDRIKGIIQNSKIEIKESRLDVDSTKKTIMETIESEKKYIESIQNVNITGNGGYENKIDKNKAYDKLLESSLNYFGLGEDKNGK